MAVDWKQNAEDAEQILCDAGDLLRECYDELRRFGNVELSEKVLIFCNRVHHCMVSGTSWGG